MSKSHPRTQPVDLEHRLEPLRQRIAKWKAHALLVTNPRDIRYLTGFVGDDSWALVTAGKKERVHILSDSRFEEQIGLEAPAAKAHMRHGTLSEELHKVARRLKIKHIALQRDYMTLGQKKAVAKKIGAARLKAVDDGLIKQRSVKDSPEVEAIRQAIAIQEKAFIRTMRTVKPGQTEEAIAARLEYEMRLLGADGTSFPSIIAADAHGSLPHFIPGKATVMKGGILLADWGAKYHGYCGDLTRVVALGSMPAKIKEIYKIVLDVQLAAIDAIAPGKSLKEIDNVSRKIIKKAGYSKEFGHGLGHGIGLDIHEQPVLSFRGKGDLEPGQVVTVEPGIYLPEVGGVRIEDDILVTANGHEVLSHLPKDLASAII